MDLAQKCNSLVNNGVATSYFCKSLSRWCSSQKATVIILP